MTRARASLAVVLLIAACKKEAPAPPPPAAPAPAPETRGLGWEALNPDATLRIQQTATSPTDCEVRCVVNATQEVKWTSQGCRATAIDLRFASPDCTRLVVVHSAPSASAFRYAKLVTVWNESGIEYEVQGGGLPIDQSKIASMGNQFRWVRGVMGEAGTKPHFTADNSGIEFEAIDGSTHTVPFLKAEPAALPQPAMPPRPAKKKATGSKGTRR